MKMLNNDDFVFDDWYQLAINDPEAFEEARLAAIESCLADIPEDRHQRLRGLQWRIDTLRTQSKTPLSACVKIYNMMWEKVTGEHGMIESITALAEPHQPRPAPSKKADVLRFSPRLVEETELA